MRGVRGNAMRDAEAQLIHDLRNAATVLRAAAAQLQEDGEMPAGVADQLVEIIGRRSDMVLGLLDELALLHQADEGQAFQHVPIPGLALAQASWEKGASTEMP